MTDDDNTGYRYEDLHDKRIVSSRSDLQRKQQEHGFPLPVRLGTRQAWFIKSEVNDWLAEQIAKRDAAIQDAPAPKRRPVGRPPGLPKRAKATPKALKPVDEAPPRRPVGRPRKTPAIGRGQ